MKSMISQEQFYLLLQNKQVNLTYEKAWTGVGECFTRKNDRRILKIKFVLLVFTDSKMCEPPPLGTQKSNIYDVYMVYRAANYTEAINLFATVLESTPIQLRTFSAHVRAKRFLFVENILQCTTPIHSKTLLQI